MLEPTMNTNKDGRLLSRCNHTLVEIDYYFGTTSLTEKFRGNGEQSVFRLLIGDYPGRCVTISFSAFRSYPLSSRSSENRRSLAGKPESISQSVSPNEYRSDRTSRTFPTPPYQGGAPDLHVVTSHCSNRMRPSIRTMSVTMQASGNRLLR